MTGLWRIGVVTGAIGFLLAGGCASDLAQPKPGDDPAFVATRPVAPAFEVRQPRSALPSTSGSLFRAGYGMHLFEDTVARRVGDILTITLLEKTDAKKKAGTDIGKSSSGTASAMVGSSGLSTPSNAELEVSADREFDGNGKSEQSNSLKGNITVVVAEVLSNGNLVVGGEKWMTLNQGKEYIRISGIVRPQDIAPDNTVSSLLVADARISYGGTGAIGDANKPGWLTRFFISPFFPF